MEIREIGWIVALLEDGDLQRAGTEVMTDRVVQLFAVAEKTLSPIIGIRGLDKIQYANLIAVSNHYPWLVASVESSRQPLKLELLRSVLLEQNAQSVRLAGSALLHNYYAMLTGLIGLSLTERLLRSVWELSSANHAQGMKNG